MYLSVSGAKFICSGAIAALFFKESSEQNIGKQFLLSSLSPGNINFRMQENTEATLRLSQNKSTSWQAALGFHEEKMCSYYQTAIPFSFLKTTHSGMAGSPRLLKTGP